MRIQPANVMKTLAVTLVVFLAYLGVGLSASSIEDNGLVFVTDPFNLPQMPIKISAATVQKVAVQLRLNLSITNLSDQDIKTIYLGVFVFDSRGKLDQIERTTVQLSLPRHSTRYDFTLLNSSVKPASHIVVAVTKVYGQVGAWEIHPSALKEAIESRVTKRPEKTVTVKYEANAILSDQDKIEIATLLLVSALKDRRIRRYISTGNVILSTQNVDFHLAISKINLSLMDQAQIQERANRDGRVYYFLLHPLFTQGSSAIAALKLRDMVRANRAFIPTHFDLTLVCRKEDGRWTVKEKGFY